MPLLFLPQLHKACYNGYRDVAKLLLQKEATVDIQTSSGWTPLHVAAKFSKVRGKTVGGGICHGIK